MNGEIIKVLITGDFCPINRVEKLALTNDYSSVTDDFKDVLSGNDLIITDLECPLTGSDVTRKKTGPHQKAHPKCINILSHAGIGLAAMANNHIMDYGSQGVNETIRLCEANDIAIVGVGKSATEAAKPYILNAKGRRIAFLNFADDEFISSPDGMYRCNPLDSINAFYDIKSAKEGNDYVVVIVHGGNEFYEFPSPRIKKLYRFMIDLGADVVVSHHTHALSGFETYKSKPVFYGLGNFIYDWPGKQNSGWNKGIVVRFLFSEDIDFELIPLKQGNEKPGVFRLVKEEAAEFESKIRYLNSFIADDSKLEEKFRDYISSVTPMYDAYIEPYFGRIISALRNHGLFPRFMSRRKRMLLTNIIRCESHREVVLGILERSYSGILSGKRGKLEVD